MSELKIRCCPNCSASIESSNATRCEYCGSYFEGLETGPGFDPKRFFGDHIIDAGCPVGCWNVDVGSNGILENAFADVRGLLQVINEKIPVSESKLDIALTFPAFILLRLTAHVFTARSNLELLKEIIPVCGAIYVNDAIQPDPVDNGMNTIIIVARDELIGAMKDHISVVYY